MSICLIQERKRLSSRYEQLDREHFALFLAKRSSLNSIAVYIPLGISHHVCIMSARK
jgi:hypothetical protein